MPQKQNNKASIAVGRQFSGKITSILKFLFDIEELIFYILLNIRLAD